MALTAGAAELADECHMQVTVLHAVAPTIPQKRHPERHL